MKRLIPLAFSRKVFERSAVNMPEVPPPRAPSGAEKQEGAHHRVAEGWAGVGWGGVKAPSVSFLIHFMNAIPLPMPLAPGLSLSAGSPIPPPGVKIFVGHPLDPDPSSG
jgi:hypothetical protein